MPCNVLLCHCTEIYLEFPFSNNFCIAEFGMWHSEKRTPMENYQLWEITHRYLIFRPLQLMGEQAFQLAVKNSVQHGTVRNETQGWLGFCCCFASLIPEQAVPLYRCFLYTTSHLLILEPGRVNQLTFKKQKAVLQASENEGSWTQALQWSQFSCY